MQKLAKKMAARRQYPIRAYWLEEWLEGGDWVEWYNVDERHNGGCWIRKYRCVSDPYDWSDDCDVGDTKEVKIC